MHFLYKNTKNGGSIHRSEITVGARRLSRWIGERGMSHRKLAARLSVSQPTVSRWLAGRAVPAWPHIEAIAVETAGAVRPDDWLSDSARSAL